MQTCNPGDVLNSRYELEKVLGAGGMGKVWLALDIKLQRHVAIKEVWPPRNSDADTKLLYARIEREARNAARAGDLPGIVTVHDVLTGDDGRPFIVMEYIDCPTLQKYVEEHGPFKAKDFVASALGLVRALVAVHKKGIMHRDIKPGNVLIQEDGTLVLLDFGIARYSDDTLTANGHVVGTPAFMSPQQLKGGKATEAMDVWLLGMTFYYALTGEVPFRREDTTATMLAVINGQLPPLPTTHPLYEAVMGMLQKDDAKRFTLHRVIDMLVPGVETAPARVHAKPRKKRRKPFRRAVLVAGLLAVTLPFGGWWAYEEFGGGRANSRVSPTLPTTASPSPSVGKSPDASVLKAKSFEMTVPLGVTATESSDDRVSIYMSNPYRTYTMEWLGRGKLQDVATRTRKEEVLKPSRLPKIDYVAGVAFWEYDLMMTCGTEPLAIKWCFRGHHMRVVVPAGKGFVLVSHVTITKSGPLSRDYPAKHELIGTAKGFAGAVK